MVAKIYIAIKPPKKNNVMGLKYPVMYGYKNNVIGLKYPVMFGYKNSSDNKYIDFNHYFDTRIFSAHMTQRDFIILSFTNQIFESYLITVNVCTSITWNAIDILHYPLEFPLLSVSIHSLAFILSQGRHGETQRFLPTQPFK